jgi:hypothetical protein
MPRELTVYTERFYAFSRRELDFESTLETVQKRLRGEAKGMFDNPQFPTMQVRFTHDLLSCYFRRSLQRNSKGMAPTRPRRETVWRQTRGYRVCLFIRP